jgi:hypothetical protein
LPLPRWDSSIDLLRKYVNVSAADFPLLIGWMTAALRPFGPYPILVLSGEQGSAKSTASAEDTPQTSDKHAPTSATMVRRMNFSLLSD